VSNETNIIITNNFTLKVISSVLKCIIKHCRPCNVSN